MERDYPEERVSARSALPPSSEIRELLELVSDALRAYPLTKEELQEWLHAAEELMNNWAFRTSPRNTENTEA